MKRAILLIIGIIASFSISAQNSDFFNYQAVIRDASGKVKANTDITILIEIVQGSANGTVTFSETHTPTTSALGIVNLQIGSINPSQFSLIDWSNTPYFIRISVDGTEMGTNQLLSVPFALYAKKTQPITETDPIFSVHPSNGISFTNISNWDAAYGWGNHASAGYLTSFTEADPIFAASAASGISPTNVLNWNDAFGWGNHASAGYLTSFTEADPIFGASAASGISPTNVSNWNAAYGWGNHASAGYLTSFTEADPIFGASAASGISPTNVLNWNDAFGWGNHASAGYLTSFTEADPIFGASAASGISASNVSNWNTAFGWGNHASAGYLTSFTEADPIFGASAASGISPTNVLNWNDAYGWGNHASAGYLTSFTEADPIFGASAASGISVSNVSNWNTAYGWGNHAGLYKASSYLPDWSEITNNPLSIVTPLNNQLLKYNSVSSKWENWTPDYLNSEVDGSITNEIQTLNLNTNQLSISGTGGNTITFTNWDTDKTDDVTLSTPTSGDMLYYNGTNWAAIPKGTTGQVLTMGSSGIPEWQNSITIPPAQTLDATFNVSTTPVTAILNGTVNPNNLPTTVTFEYGTTTSYGSSATADQSPVLGISNVNVSCDLTSLTPGTLYHFRVKTVNALGTSYGEDMSFTLLGIGLSWEGGIIFYLNSSGLHGLVAAETDQGNATWGCISTLITGADGTAVGTGNQNTLDIVSGCPTAGIAAKICNDLVLNTYSDWFLPSKDELGLMYTNLKQSGLGGFSLVNYWSSSESSNDYSYKQNFSTGSAGTSTKDVSYNIRAARAF